MSTALITGASGAIGREICDIVATKNINLILADRNSAKSEMFAAELRKKYPSLQITTYSVDLSDSIDRSTFARKIVTAHAELNYLFLNAGALPESLQFSKQNRELSFEVNALSSLALIDGLRPALAKARQSWVIATSAGIALQVKKLEWDTLLKPTKFTKLFGPYVQSKQALNVLIAALAPELNADGIILRAADPGPTKSPLTKGPGTPLWMRLFYFMLPGPRGAAQKITGAAFSAAWKNATGCVIVGKKIAPLPPELADKTFQADFLRRARALI